MAEVKDFNNETVEKIVECSIELFNEYGYDGTTISNISKKTGMSRGILYHYFKNKDSLYLYCTQKCVDEFRLYIKEHATQVKTGKQAALALLSLQQDFLRQHSQYRVLWYNTLALRPAHLFTELSEIRKTLKEDNAVTFESTLRDVKLGNGVSVDDALHFMSLLQNNAVCALDIFSNRDNIKVQQEVVFRLVTIFINGLEQNFDTDIV